MRLETAFWMAMLLLLLAIAAVAYSEEGFEPFPGQHYALANQERTAELGPEVARLMKEKPLPFPVEVVVINIKTVEWLSTPNNGYSIIILDRGSKSENEAMLRHSWEHARQIAVKKNPHLPEMERDAKRVEKRIMDVESARDMVDVDLTPAERIHR
jgi:hypothetical protein